MVDAGLSHPLRLEGDREGGQDSQLVREARNTARTHAFKKVLLATVVNSERNSFETIAFISANLCHLTACDRPGLFRQFINVGWANRQ